MEIEAPRGAVAPAWHTVVVLLALVALSLSGARSGNLPFVRDFGRAGGYVLVMAFEWAIVAFIWYGVRRRGMRLRDLIGGLWPGPLSVLRDLGIAIGFLVVAQIVLGVVGYLLKAGANQAIRNLLPRTPAEIAIFLALALTAGFCEEVTFRGYLQRQFAALTRATAGGILLQGIAFGAAHGYQGWRLMLVIAVYGCLFGLLARWRRSLRPGMLAHFLQDGIGGIALRHLLH